MHLFERAADMVAEEAAKRTTQHLPRPSYPEVLVDEVKAMPTQIIDLMLDQIDENGGLALEGLALGEYIEVAGPPRSPNEAIDAFKRAMIHKALEPIVASRFKLTPARSDDSGHRAARAFG